MASMGKSNGICNQRMREDNLFTVQNEAFPCGQFAPDVKEWFQILFLLLGEGGGI
jgi:hypothetical protein